MLDGLKFGDRITVRSAGIAIDDQGLFVKVQGDSLVWIGTATSGAFIGQPTVFVTSLNAITVEKIS